MLQKLIKQVVAEKISQNVQCLYTIFEKPRNDKIIFSLAHMNLEKILTNL